MKIVREAGYSEKYFFYRTGAVSDFDCRIVFTFREKIDPEAMQKAADGALECVPAFAIRPVIYKETIYFEENHAPVVLFPDDGAVRYFGTDEMNGYLHCILLGERHAVLSFFHGLSDFAGIWDYVLNLIRLYAAERGEEAGDVLHFQTGEMIHDPYGRLADGSVLPPWSYSNEQVFELPKESYSQGAFCGTQITFSTQRFLEATHQAKTSFLPLITTTISDIIFERFDTQGKDVVARSTVNLRPVFGASTMENFSESFLIPLSWEESGMRISRQAGSLKDVMKLQLVPAYFQRTLAKKVEAVKVCEHRAQSNPYDDGKKRRITYTVIYPGKLDMPERMEKYLSDIRLEMCARFDEGFMVVCSTFGDQMSFHVYENDSTLPVSKAIEEKLSREGVAYTSERIRSHTCNLMALDRLKRRD